MKHLGWLLLCLGALPFSLGADDKVAIDKESGLVIDDDWFLVRGLCTRCHSARIVIQNRLSAARWEALIRWMQQTQGLEQFDPETERKLIAYLAKHYGSVRHGRRKPLPAHLLPPLPAEKKQKP